MAVELNELLKKFNDMNINILAGENGLDSLVTCVHMVENEEIGNFVEVGEVIFTTGIALNEKNTLLKIANKGINKKASGLIVNIGPYIKTIPIEIVEFCNQHNFPLMSVPWEVNMANIMRVMTFEISNKSMKKMDIEAVLKNAIINPESENLYEKLGSKSLIEKDANFICIFMQFEENKNTVSQDRLNKIKFNIRFEIEKVHKTTNIVSVFDSLVLVIYNYVQADIYKLIKRYKTVVDSYIKKTEEVNFYVGESVVGLNNIHKSYKEAVKLLRVKGYYGRDKHVIYYNEIGFLKLILEIENKEVLMNYYEESIKQIVDYDSYHNSDLLITLENYLKYDGSLKSVADKMIIHRNTVNYKLTKVADILDCNLSCQSTRSRLEIGIAIYKLFPELK